MDIPVTRLDIIKTDLVVHNQVCKDFTFINNPMSIKEDTLRVYRSLSRDYLINDKDIGIFQEFENDSYIRGYKMCDQNLTILIKSLPWWKRLFNKF